MVKEKTLKMVKPKVLVVQGNSPADMIRMAVSGGADLDKLEKLLTIQERWDALQAKKVFNSAFTLAQGEISVVTKNKTNLQTHSKYASLDDVIESAKPVYTKQGFSIIFYEGETTVLESIRICADVLHTAGHKETYHYDVPLDGKGIQGNPNMTKIHAKASSTSYGRRYLMCMIWNIPTQDNDGNGAKPEVAKPERKAAEPEKQTTLPKKSLSNKTKEFFVQAQKVLGDKDFFKVIGEQGYERVDQIIDEGVAKQILSDMETVYSNKYPKKENGK